jgi:ABC-2 type transport system ATP-binding protein
LHVRLSDPSSRPEAQSVLERVLGAAVELESDRARLSARVGDAALVGAAMGELSSAGIDVAELVMGQPSMDEVFLSLTGRPAGDTTTTTEESA